MILLLLGLFSLFTFFLLLKQKSFSDFFQLAKLKRSSSVEFMINLCMQNFIPFLVHTCSPSRFSSVQLTSSVVSDSLQPHGLQHAGPPCPSSTPRVYSNSCPLSPWSHPTISSSVFSSCLQSFPASGSFPISQFFASDGQSIGVSASASVLPMNIQDWFPLGWTGWISLQSKGFSRVFPTPQFKSIEVEEYQRKEDCNRAGPYAAFPGWIFPPTTMFSTCRKTLAA